MVFSKRDTGDRPALFERPPGRPAGMRELVRDIGLSYVVNAVIGLIFAITGPVAVILTAGATGHLRPEELSSWLFGVFALNGLLTVVMSLVYRQPMGIAFTIPGSVLVGEALTHLSWPEVVGAFYVTGVLIVVLGASGVIGRAMSALPMPIVMAMVAGVFMTFGIGLVRAVGADPGVAVPMVLAFLVLSARSTLGRLFPPILGALVIGAVATAMTGGFSAERFGTSVLATPVFTAPSFSARALFELVIPLAITVLVVQNGQGIAVLRQAGHNPPVNVLTVVCGVGSVIAASVGAVSTCLTGATNALLTASGRPERQYTAGVAWGVLAIVVGVFSSLLVGGMTSMPAAFVATLGGLAMLAALRGAFVAAFSTRFTMGALVAFVVTVSGISVLNIGSAFWGLVFGCVLSLLLDREDWQSSTR